MVSEKKILVRSSANTEHMLELKVVDTVLHGLDRGGWYIPASGPRPRYEEQVASQNQSALCTVVLEVAGQSIGGREWRLLEATNFLP